MKRKRVGGGAGKDEAKGRGAKKRRDKRKEGKGNYDNR